MAKKKISFSNEKWIEGVLTILLGILFLILQGKVVSIAMTILGVALIIMAVLDLLDHQTFPAIVKAVFGVVVLIFGCVVHPCGAAPDLGHLRAGHEAESASQGQHRWSDCDALHCTDPQHPAGAAPAVQPGWNACVDLHCCRRSVDRGWRHAPLQCAQQEIQEEISPKQKLLCHVNCPKLYGQYEKAPCGRRY